MARVLLAALSRAVSRRNRAILCGDPEDLCGGRARGSELEAVPPSTAATILACDFLTVETVRLTRIYVLFFASLERRRIERSCARRSERRPRTLTPRCERFGVS
jgi:hypothetical protein